MANLSACRAGLLLLVLAALSGCQTGGNTELLERQLRIQEDRIYELEDQLERHCNMLQACRKENQALKTTGSPSSSTGSAASPSPSSATPNSTAPAPLPADLTPPKIELDLPPVPPPSSSSDAGSLPTGPSLNAAAANPPPSSDSSDSSTLHIRMPAGEVPMRSTSGEERFVDQAAGADVAPQAYYEPAQDAQALQRAERSAARRPKWSPYR